MPFVSGTPSSVDGDDKVDKKIQMDWLPYKDDLPEFHKTYAEIILKNIVSLDK